MAAPASSSSSALAINFSLPSSLSVQGRDLLKITPKELTKHGFYSKPWANYLVNSFLPIFQAKCNIVIQQTKNTHLKDELLNKKARVESLFNELLGLISSLPSKGKTWQNQHIEIENASCCAGVMHSLILGDNLYFQQANTKESLNLFTEGLCVLAHLNHLLIDRLCLDFNPNNENCFMVKNDAKSWLAVRKQRNWQLGDIIADRMSPTLTFSTWNAETGSCLHHAVLIKGDELIHQTPFIGIKFILDVDSPEVIAALQARTPLKFIPNQTALSTEIAYCTGIPSRSDKGNTLLFYEESGSRIPEIERGIYQSGTLDQNTSPEIREFTELATQIMKENLMTQLQTQPLENVTFSFVHVLPKTPEEANERMIETLELALEAPEKNALLIEYITEQSNFTYSEEDLLEAQTLAGVSFPLEASLGEKAATKVEESAAALAAMPPADEQKEAEDIFLSPVVMAHAVMQKLKKQRPGKQRPAAQQPKSRPILAAPEAASSSSSRQPLLSKEELKTKLSKSKKMDPQLLDKATALLSGERLSSKREEDKFFFDILSYQAKSSGSTMQKGNKGGSHHPIRLLRQTEAGGKITFRAATLVNKHGTDAGRGHSLSVQQDKLLRLFTPVNH